MNALDKAARKRSAVIKMALATREGQDLIKLLEENFAVPVFDNDPYRHAYNAGASEVLVFIKRYEQMRFDDEDTQLDLQIPA